MESDLLADASEFIRRGSGSRCAKAGWLLNWIHLARTQQPERLPEIRLVAEAARLQCCNCEDVKLQIEEALR